MKTFKDNKGRQWNIEINVIAIKRVRTLIGFDLLEIQGGRVFERLSEDPILLVDVIYALIKPAADGASVSDVDFGESMAGDPIEAATNALIGELIDFFPNPEARKNLTSLLEKTRTAGAKLSVLLAERIGAINPEKLVESVLNSAGDSSTKPPESAESARTA